MTLKNIYIFILLLILAVPVSAQYTWFSQYDYNLLSNNPAFIANDNYIKLVSSFKNSTITNGYNKKLAYFSAEVPFKLSQVKDHTGALGLTLVDDNFSTENVFRRTGVSLTHGQSLKISGRSYLSAGLNFEYYQRKINNEGFTTGSQWLENQGFDPTAGLGETQLHEKVNVFTLSSGIHWKLVDSRGFKKAHGSIAMFNINKPNESVYGTEGNVPMRITLSGSYKVFEKGSFAITPDLLFNTLSSQYFVTVGGLVNYSFSNENPFSVIKSGSIDCGIRYTYDYSTALIFRLNQKNVITGINVDLGTSRSNKYGFKGNTFEVLLVLKKEFFDRSPAGQAELIAADDDDKYKVGGTRDFILQSEVLKQSQVPVEPEEYIPDRPDRPVKVKLEKDFEFKFNEAQLDENAKVYLDEIVMLLNFNKNLKLEIIGHTDNVGSKEANQKLSEQRAEVVYDYILSKGINKKRLITKGKADTDPAAPNDTEANRARNRRVEFILYTD